MNTKYQSMLTNLEILDRLRYSKIREYWDKLVWMQELNIGDIYGALYKRLFKLAPRLQIHLEKILHDALPTSNHRLICIHVRLGNEAFASDYAKRNSVDNLPKIWGFINEQSTTEYDKVFVMSDSQKVIESAYEQSFKDRLITIPGKKPSITVKQYRTIVLNIEPY